MTDLQKQIIAVAVTALIIIWLISISGCATSQSDLYRANNDGYNDGFTDGYDAAKLYGKQDG